MANIYNINIDQGSTHTFSITYNDSDGNPIDLSGYSGRLQVRELYTSTSANIVLTSTPAYGITMGSTAGTVDVRFLPVDTQVLDNVKRAYVYDLEIESGSGVVTRLIEGTFLLLPEATR